jgi:hypothetical protein
MQTVVLLEFFELPNFHEQKHILCVTQQAYERVLSSICDNECPEQIVTKVLYDDVVVTLWGQTEPFDFTQVARDGSHTLRDFLPPPPPFANFADLKALASFPHSDSYVYTPPNGDTYKQSLHPEPGDSNIVSIVETFRCWYARMLFFARTHTPKQTGTPNTLYVRGGGQHGTVVWGAASAVLRTLAQPFDRFAGDSFGAVVAVLCALDPTGEKLFFERMIETCSRMKLDDEDRRLSSEVAIQFAHSALHDYIHLTLAELDLPVDILVANLETGMECRVLNRHTAPDMTLGDALVASMSIPVVIGEHYGCFDGGMVAHEYLAQLDDKCTVVGVTSFSNLSGLVEMFGPLGFVTESVFNQWLALNSAGDPLYCTKPFHQFAIPAREQVSVFGGSIGRTSWHVLNFNHGFETVVSLLQ